MDSRTNYKNMLLALLLILAGLAGAIAPQTAAAKKPKFTIIPKTLYVPAEGGVYEVSIIREDVFFIWGVDASDWIRQLGYRPNDIRTSYDFQFFFYPNTEGSREGTITFKTSKGDVKYKLIQLGGAKPEKIKFTFTPEELKVDELENEVSFSLNCNLPFIIESESKIDKPNWVSFTKGGFPKFDSPQVSYPMSIFINPNPTEKTREGVITFTTTAGDVKLKVTQEAAGTIKFTREPKELKVAANRKDVWFTLSCTEPYQILDIIQPYWLSVYRQKFEEEAVQELRIAVEENLGPEREGVISFKTSKGNVTFKVTQAAAGTKPEFTLEPKELDAGPIGNYYEFTLSCNVPYLINGLNKPDWLSVNGNSGVLEAIQKMTIGVMPNNGGKREGVITFKTTEGEVKLKVTQAAGSTKPEPEKAVFTLEPKELKVDANRNDASFTLSCNVPYHINDFDKPDWLLVSGNSADYKAIQKMTIEFQPNTGPERTADVVFKTNAGNVTLKVTQAAGSTKPDPEAKLTLDPKELKVEAKGGMKEVTLSCNKEFLINRFEVPDWISNYTYYSTAAKSNEIKLFISQNTGAERTADAVFKTNRGDVTLKVTQAAAGTKPEAKFTFEPKELKVETDGGKKEVKLSCNQAFELNKVTVPSWMERVPSSATSDEKSRVCAFNIKPNTGAERKGEIIFHTDKGNITLKVTQAGKKEKPEPTLTLSPDMLTFPTGGGKQTINVKSDYGWDTKASAASASWMKLTTDVKTGKIVVEVTPNTSTKKRGATIGVVSFRRRIGNGTPITRHILVTQEGGKIVEPPVAATGISLNPAAMTMGSGGGTVGFNVYAGKGWTISGSPDWMHPDATRGSGTRLVIVRFDRNESGAERTGKLTVKSDDGKAERTFTLTQRAGQRKPTPSPGSTPSEEYDYDLALNPEEITVGPSDGAGSSISVVTGRLWAGSTTEDWIRLESAVGRGNGTFTFTVAPNPSKEMRHGTITVRTQQGMDELKVAIHQQGNDGSVVSPAEVKVSNVTLDPATLTVNGDLSTALISAIVSPDNARNKGLLWMSSNASVATVQVSTPKQSAALPQLRFAPDADDYALVTIVGKGKAVITAAASDGSGIVARCEVNVLSTVANTVPYAPQAKVYTVGPTLYLSLPTAETVQVYTLAGTLYRTWQAPAGDTSLTLPAGTYIIKVGQLTEKVVVR